MPTATRAGDSAPAAPLIDAIGRTRDWLLERQAAAGYWVAELEGDTILESEYILLLAFLGGHGADAPSKAARYIAGPAIARRRLGHVSRRQSSRSAAA